MSNEAETKIMELAPPPAPRRGWRDLDGPSELQQQLVIWAAVVAAVALCSTITLLCLMLVIQTAGW